MTTAELRELLAIDGPGMSLHEALGYQDQIDEEGVMIGVSREALEIARTILLALPALLAAAEERDALRARLDAAPVGKFEDVVAHVAYIRFEDSDSPRQYDGKRVALVELPAPPVAGGGEG